MRLIYKLASFLPTVAVAILLCSGAYAGPIADLVGETTSDLQSAVTWDLVLVLAIFPFIAACWLAATRQFALAVGMVIVTALVLWGGQQVIGA